MNCSRDVRLLLRRLLLDELLNGLLGLNGLGTGIHPAFLDGLEDVYKRQATRFEHNISNGMPLACVKQPFIELRE